MLPDTGSHLPNGGEGKHNNNTKLTEYIIIMICCICSSWCTCCSHVAVAVVAVVVNVDDYLYEYPGQGILNMLKIRSTR